MTAKKRIITRRDFLRAGSYVVMGSLMGLPMPKSASARQALEARPVAVGQGPAPVRVVVAGVGRSLVGIFTLPFDRGEIDADGAPQDIHIYLF